MLAVEKVVKTFGARHAVRDLTLRVQPGTLLGLLGPNGAGKTTTLLLIAGLLKPDRGRVTLFDIDAGHEPARVRALLTLARDAPSLFEPLRAREFLDFVGDMYEIAAAPLAARRRVLTEVLQLGPHLETCCLELSRGTRQKLSLAAALLPDPPVCLLDEPTLGLDPHAAHVLHAYLRRLTRRGRIIVVSTHLLDLAERLCDQVAILDRGRLLVHGTVDALRRSRLQPAARVPALERVFLELTRQDEADFRRLLDEIC